MMKAIEKLLRGKGPKIRRFFIVVVGDVRSAIIAGICSALGAYAGAVYAQSDSTKTFVANLSDSGVGYPALLFSEAKKEDKELQINFAPSDLRQIAVCEYYSDTRQSYRQIMEQFLKAYSTCFIPVWRGPKSLEIRRNQYSGQLIETVDQRGQKSFWCKCSSDQIPPGQKEVKQSPRY
jgi:hypothetical protein